MRSSPSSIQSPFHRLRSSKLTWSISSAAQLTRTSRFSSSIQSPFHLAEKQSSDLRCHQRCFWRLNGFNGNDYEIDSMCLALTFYSLSHLFPFLLWHKVILFIYLSFQKPGRDDVFHTGPHDPSKSLRTFRAPFPVNHHFSYFYSQNYASHFLSHGARVNLMLPLHRDLWPKLSPSNQYQPHIICPFLEINNHLTKP